MPSAARGLSPAEIYVERVAPKLLSLEGRRVTAECWGDGPTDVLQRASGRLAIRDDVIANKLSARCPVRVLDIAGSRPGRFVLVPELLTDGTWLEATKRLVIGQPDYTLVVRDATLWSPFLE